MPDALMAGVRCLVAGGWWLVGPGGKVPHRMARGVTSTVSGHMDHGEG